MRGERRDGRQRRPNGRHGESFGCVVGGVGVTVHGQAHGESEQRVGAHWADAVAQMDFLRSERRHGRHLPGGDNGSVAQEFDRVRSRRGSRIVRHDGAHGIYGAELHVVELFYCGDAEVGGRGVADTQVVDVEPCAVLLEEDAQGQLRELSPEAREVGRDGIPSQVGELPEVDGLDDVCHGIGGCGYLQLYCRLSGRLVQLHGHVGMSELCHIDIVC